jgi:hypothetical protein
MRIAGIVAYHLSDSSSENTAESASQRRRREEQCHAIPTFITHIPLRDIIVHARKQATFERTQEYPSRHQTRVIGHEALADHRERPEEHDKSKPYRRPRAFHHHVRRNLRSDIEREQNGKAVIILKTMELEILLKVIETGVANVGAIKKTQPVLM